MGYLDFIIDDRGSEWLRDFVGQDDMEPGNMEITVSSPSHASGIVSIVRSLVDDN